MPIFSLDGTDGNCVAVPKGAVFLTMTWGRMNSEHALMPSGRRRFLASTHSDECWSACPCSRGRDKDFLAR